MAQGIVRNLYFALSTVGYTGSMGLLLNLLLSFSAHAGTADGVGGFASWIKSMAPPGSKAACVANQMDGNYGMTELKGATGDIGFGNVGANIRNRAMLERGPCLATLAQGLFAEINEVGKNSRRPSIQDTTGKGELAKLKPGWVWEKAMKFANGNPRLAMKLLNLCLNDDFNSGHPVNLYPIFIADSDRREIGFAEKRMKEARAQMADPNLSESEKSIAASGLNAATNEAAQVRARINAADRSKPVKGNIECPPKDSLAYVQGALGAEADIIPELKEALPGIQKVPGQGIPSKTYHVYSAASLGCDLSSCGEVDPATINRFQAMVAQAYRGFSLCENLQIAKSQREGLQKKFGADVLDDGPWNELSGKVEAADNFAKLKELIPCDSSGFSSLCTQLLRTESSAGRRARMARLRDSLDGATVFEKGLFSAEVGGIKTPCSFNLYRGDKLPWTNDQEFKPSLWNRAIHGNGCAQSSWSEPRCRAALERLRTWEVDEGWTTHQHSRGSKFGVAACRGTPALEDAEKTSCSALEAVKSKIAPAAGAVPEASR